ncbi:DsbA family protein [Candidatus Pacearchaeota archaeon]|nr:DsbA family protein [Candidatus Pacearchaeota archaeon]
MKKDSQHKLTIFALILSLAALLLSGVSLSKAGSGSLDDEGFMAKVEKGIEDYIEKQRNEQAAANQPGSGEAIEVSVDDDAMKGDKNAPVTIVEYSDFECPFCARFYENTYPELVSEYIDKGKVKLVFRDFPLGFHKNAKPAAIAAECAREQDGDKGYYKYHDTIFENQSQLSVDSLKKWAVDLGLDAGQFNECLDSEKYGEEVDKDFSDGQSYGVSGTPAFFINGRLISGAHPFSVFKTIIDEELAK